MEELETKLIRFFPNLATFPSTVENNEEENQDVLEYFSLLAKSGRTGLKWEILRPMVWNKLQAALAEILRHNPIEDIPASPNNEEFSLRLAKQRLKARLDEMDVIPFTIQRLCELLLTPLLHYNRVDNYVLAIEKSLCVSSSIDAWNNACDAAARRTMENGGNENGVSELDVANLNPSPVNKRKISESSNEYESQSDVKNVPLVPGDVITLQCSDSDSLNVNETNVTSPKGENIPPSKKLRLDRVSEGVPESPPVAFNTCDAANDSYADTDEDSTDDDDMDTITDHQQNLATPDDDTNTNGALSSVPLTTTLTEIMASVNTSDDQNGHEPGSPFAAKFEDSVSENTTSIRNTSPNFVLERSCSEVTIEDNVENLHKSLD